MYKKITANMLIRCSGYLIVSALFVWFILDKLLIGEALHKCFICLTVLCLIGAALCIVWYFIKSRVWDKGTAGKRMSRRKAVEYLREYARKYAKDTAQQDLVQAIAVVLYIKGNVESIPDITIKNKSCVQKSQALKKMHAVMRSSGIKEENNGSKDIEQITMFSLDTVMTEEVAENKLKPKNNGKLRPVTKKKGDNNV